jgi:hypothetical protein
MLSCKLPKPLADTSGALTQTKSSPATAVTPVARTETGLLLESLFRFSVATGGSVRCRPLKAMAWHIQS